MRIAALLLLVLASSALGADSDVVAEIGSTTKLTVTRGELELNARLTARYRALLDMAPVDSAALHACLEETLAQTVNEKVFLLECDRLEIQLPEADAKALEDEVAAAASALESIHVPPAHLLARKRANARIACLIRHEVSMADFVVSETDARAYYEEHEDDFALPARTVAWVLEERNGEHADELRQKLAKKHDEDREDFARAQGMERRQIPDSELEEQLGPRGLDLVKLKPGESAVIPTNSGFFVVSLVTRRPAAKRPFEDVEEEVREKLRDAAWDERVTAYMARLRARTPHVEKLGD